MQLLYIQGIMETTGHEKYDSPILNRTHSLVDDAEMFAGN